MGGGVHACQKKQQPQDKLMGGGDLSGENGIGGAMGGDGIREGPGGRKKGGRKWKEWMGVSNREKGE